MTPGRVRDHVHLYLKVSSSRSAESCGCVVDGNSYQRVNLRDMQKQK